MERNFFIIIILALLLTQTGCTFNPFTTDNKLSGNAAGPIIGGVAGAGSMSLLGAPKGLVALAGVGGAALGYYVTTLRFASGGVLQSGGQVYTVGDYITVEIPSDKLFDVNSSDFLPEAGPILDSALAALNYYPNNNIIISGNTSGFGTNRYEQKLSEARARQVAGYLWANGVNNFKDKSIHATRKLTYVGYGNYFPIANNLRNNSIRSNSRIQITGYPSKADLHLDKRHRVFNNIGDINEKPVNSNPQPVMDFNKVFPNYGLPESGGTRSNDFKDTYNETARPQNQIVHGSGFKGE